MSGHRQEQTFKEPMVVTIGADPVAFENEVRAEADLPFKPSSDEMEKVLERFDQLEAQTLLLVAADQVGDRATSFDHIVELIRCAYEDSHYYSLEVISEEIMLIHKITEDHVPDWMAPFLIQAGGSFKEFYEQSGKMTFDWRQDVH